MNYGSIGAMIEWFQVSGVRITTENGQCLKTAFADT